MTIAAGNVTVDDASMIHRAQGVTVDEATRRSTVVFLDINGIEISGAGNDDVYDLVIDVAGREPTVDTMAERLRQLAT